jgi:DNA-binding transcriptional LysR family regulator
MLNPLHLRTLSVVLRVGSFAAAGRQLGYTGSAVSQQMSALEADSGLVLFERDAHGIRPTQAARLMSERASETLGALASLENAVREMATGTRGRLGIGSFPTASEVLVPNALARFSRTFRDVDVRFVDSEPSNLIPRLVEGDLDVVVVYRYDMVPESWPSGFRRLALIDEELRMLVPRDVMVGAEAADLTEFSDLSWISTREGSAGSLAVERACARAGFTPNIDYRTNDYDVVRSFVRAGLGVAAVPSLAYAGRSDLRVLQARGLEIRRHVEVLTAKHQVPAVEGMVRALKASAATHMSASGASATLTAPR